MGFIILLINITNYYNDIDVIFYICLYCICICNSLVYTIFVCIYILSQAYPHPCVCVPTRYFFSGISLQTFCWVCSCICIESFMVCLLACMCMCGMQLVGISFVVFHLF